MSSNDINDKILDNPFTNNLYDTYVVSFKDVDKREGFNINGRNRNILTDSEKYIVDIQKQHSNLISTIEQIYFIKTYLRRFPDKNYLSENGINRLSYIQYHTEVLSHKIHTVLEIMKLMINEVYVLNIPPVDCTWRMIISKLDKKILPLKIIDKYFRTFAKIIELRHINTHRGVYSDKGQDEIESKYGFTVYELHKRLGINTDIEFQRMFPQFMIESKIKELKKSRVDLVTNILGVISELTNEFLFSLNEEFERRMKNAPQQK